MNLVRSAYTTALRLATPAVLVHLARRSRRQTGTSDDWRTRLGFVARDTRRPVWIHAASAGEMQAALALAVALGKDYPVRLSAFSASGLARAAEALPEIPASLAPLDLPGAWRRFLDRTEPQLLVLIEGELWPNLLAATTQRRLPVVLASARLTPAAAHRLARFPATTRKMLGALSDVLAQSAEDLERLRVLGLPETHGRVAGNLKSAQIIPDEALAQARALRAGSLAGRRVWVAGSVREGEEAFIAEAAALIRERFTDVVALIAPRHPERAPAFSAALAAHGIAALGADALDSNHQLDAGTAVVVDRLGILLTLYAASDAAFVGGTFAAIGGHNLLEPALLALPILVGPHLDNVREQAARLAAAGALTVVGDAQKLAERISGLLNDPEGAGRAGEAGRRCAAESRALTATLAGLTDYLAPTEAVAG
ncbi:MAG: 3-deoxy-D-manno-octulosonic acid transferase [Gammaproteobacteria bacterium]